MTADPESGGSSTRGRPSTYTAEAHAEICRRLSEGETLADICRDEGMPAPSTVSDWKRAHPDFSVDFGRARDIGFDAIAARTRKTARGDDPEKGGDSTGDVQRDKLIIDTDLKLLAKWDPRRYGDKHVHVGGGPEDAPIQYANMTREAREARIKELEERRRGADGGGGS